MVVGYHLKYIVLHVFSQHIFILFHVMFKCEPNLTIWRLKTLMDVISSIVE